MEEKLQLKVGWEDKILLDGNQPSLNFNKEVKSSTRDKLLLMPIGGDTNFCR